MAGSAVEEVAQVLLHADDAAPHGEADGDVGPSRGSALSRDSIRFFEYPNETPPQSEAFDGIVLKKGRDNELLSYVEHPTKGFTYRVN